MSQQVKICTGYSEKISENYNSRQFSVSLETSVSINGQTAEVTEASEKLFALCKKLVEKQKGVSTDNLFPGDSKQETKSAETPLPFTETGSPHITEAATDKQIKCVFAVGKAGGRSSQEIRNWIKEKFKKAVEQLTKNEASILIKELNHAG